MNNRFFDAVIFDLDGVITKTALVHSEAWKEMFDTFLKSYAEKMGTKFVPFSHKNDYLHYVDGKPRYKGVADFLTSRGIELPYGDPSDDASMETICGLGNRKNQTFNEILERDGIEVYPSTVILMHELRKKGYRIGVASSSKNCENVLKTAGLLDLIETRVDGVVLAEMGLKGKPEAAIFTKAADNLGVSYSRTVIVEDAVSGVQAGRNGHFGLVLGIARENNQIELYENGADVVVEDLSEFGIREINKWFENDLEINTWQLKFRHYDPKKERSHEALLTVGNGYFATRGALNEVGTTQSNYPGTYMAGMYNRLITNISGRAIENEDFVNLPNWLPITFKIEGGTWFDPNKDSIVSFERTLDFKTGLLSLNMLVEDTHKQRTQICTKRFVSMKNSMIAAASYALTPINYSKSITIKSGIDGAIKNEGVERYKSLNSKHLEPIEQGVVDNKIAVLVETNQSQHRIAEAALHHIFYDEKKITAKIELKIETAQVSELFTVDVAEGKTIKLEKIVAVCSDKEAFVTDALQQATNALDTTFRFATLFGESVAAWQKIWDKIDIRIQGDHWSQKLLRMHLYHLMTSVSEFNKTLDASITARGLHGEAYRGHIFWDELFVLPFYDFHFSEVVKSLLLYRYRRLDEARKYAAQKGYKGAMYPWQSGSDGREETQTVHLNPLTGEWGDDHSALQRHVSLAIAYNIWDYYWICNDRDFLSEYGCEMFFEIARFWASKSKFNLKTGRYEIDEVMGPDEFHEHYPNAKKGGLKDNAYTNIMVAWLFQKANEIYAIVGENRAKQLGFEQDEIESWLEIASKLNLVINQEGIISQYDGYFELQELDWDAYRSTYGNIYRLDRILKAEGKSPDMYKVAKQADLLMVFYNLNKTEVDDLLAKMGYSLPADYLQKNLQYYLKRTSHGSTLSRVVHAQLAAMTGNYDLSWELYQEALSSDYNDIQGGTTAEGIHAGVMSGTILIALNTFAGLNYRENQLHINPNLPKYWQSISFNITFKHIDYMFEIDAKTVQIYTNKPATIFIKGKRIELKGQTRLNVHY
ncbi:MAG: HAD-IA family hydrolase [Lentimicrobiaceae bacterium]|jgi:beta-phosphoglucomutase family hydrolase|nr:HAD-IA family hydrolase [Lentimicrobiaceae bacterium]